MEGLGAFLSVLKYYPRVFGLVWRTTKTFTFYTMGLTVVQALVYPTQIWLSKVLIDDVVDGFGAGLESFSESWQVIAVGLCGILLVWIVGLLCQAMLSSVKEIWGFQVWIKVEYEILKKASQLDISFYETPSFHDTMERARRDGYRIYNLAVLWVELFGSMISLLGVCALLVRLHALAVPLVILTALPQVIISAYFAGKRFSLVGTHTPARRMASYLSNLIGSREAAKEIRLLGLRETLLSRFLAYWQRFLKETRGLRFKQVRIGLVGDSVSILGTVVIWGYAAIQGIRGQLSVGDVALVLQASEQSRSGMKTLFENGGIFYEHLLFAGLLMDFLDMEPDAVQGALTHSAKGEGLRLPENLGTGIEFRAVSFRYPGTDTDVLRGVSFKVSPGESIALVGANGAGKTTLVKLLVRLYDPTEGEILFDGKNIVNYSQKELWKRTSVVFQDFVRYELSVRENVGFGQVQALQDETRVKLAIAKGGAESVVENLPNGLETMLGRTLEDGTDLSGGDWQKIALSRAFMRDSDLLILDEPTAALDAFAEAEVYNKLSELATGKTKIFISHRFSTVRAAGRIIVLKSGTIAEEGTHDELINRGGHYARMFKVQADRYR